MEETGKKPRKESFREKTSHTLALPREAVAGMPRLELTGDRELYLEHYKDILSYSKEEICVDGGRWMLRLTGRDLEIKAMREGELRLFGWVHSLELL